MFLNLAKAQNVPQVTFQRTTKGTLYHIFTKGTGDKIKLTDVITFQAVQKTEKDSVLFSTYASGNPVKIQVQASQNIGDLMDVFPLMSVKDSAIAKVPTDSIFKGHEDQRPPFLPKGSNLIFLLKIDRIQGLSDALAEKKAMEAAMNAAKQKMKAEEPVAMQKYITDKKLLVKTTPSGLNYIITSPSLKRKALKGDTLLVNYAGRTLDGTLFDSSIESLAKASGLQQPGRNYEPIKVVVGNGEVIKGWDEGLLLLNEGSKATFIIPSGLAYGEQGAGRDIKPYSTLVFDLEVVKVKPCYHAPVKPPVKKTGTKKTYSKTSTVKKTQTTVKKTQ